MSKKNKNKSRRRECKSFATLSSIRALASERGAKQSEPVNAVATDPEEALPTQTCGIETTDCPSADTATTADSQPNSGTHTSDALLALVRGRTTVAPPRTGFALCGANDRIATGLRQNEPRDLFRGLWFEGELCALYADTNVGKSILAMQAAEEVAKKGIKVVYIDLELSDKAMQMRCTDPETGEVHRFPDNFDMLTMNFSQFLKLNPDADEDGFVLLNCIEECVRAAGAKAIVLDNITAVCAGAESGDVAVKLVNRLVQMRDEAGISVLMIAHTPKIDPYKPITRNCMAGSKRLISLIDSAFAIGECALNPEVKYIKQTKCRFGSMTMGERNVAVCRIARVDGMLNFVVERYASEAEMLAKPADSPERAREVVALRRRGLSYREISARTGYGKTKIGDILKNYETVQDQLPCEDTTDFA